MDKTIALKQDLRKKKILIIDDDQICLIGMEMLLFGTDFTLITVLGGKEGLKFLLKNPKIDLIFLDLMMPELDGLNLLKIIKDDPVLSKIPVIIQTGVVSEIDIKESYNLGAVAVLKKPYTKDIVLREINKVLMLKD